MKIFYYLRKFWGIPAFEKRVLINSILLSIFYTIILKIVPLKFYKQFFKKNQCVNNDKTACDKIFLTSKKAIARTSRIIPWKLSCIVKSLTFNNIVIKSGINTNIEIEVYKDSSLNIKLHAFVSYNNSAVYLNRKNSLGILIPIFEK
jgi:hypothetical protein